MIGPVAVLVASCVGALLFFFGGYLLAQSTGAPRPRRDAADNSGATARDTARTADETVRNALELVALRDEVAAYRNRVASAERDRGRIAELEEELRQRQDQKDRLEAANRQWHEAWKGREGEVGALQDEKTELARRLRQCQDEIERLKVGPATPAHLGIEADALQRHRAELDRYKDEATRLNAQLAELPHLRDALAGLQEENRRLRALGFASQPPAPPAPAATALPEADSAQQLLEQFAGRAEVRDTALADEHGLLVAGTGQHAEGLALASALCDGLLVQLRDLLPLAALHQCVVVDSNSVAVVIHPLQSGSVRLLLGSLSVGQRPDDATIETLAAQAARLVAARGDASA